MPDQVTQVQPSGDGGNGFGPGLIIGIVVIILILLGAAMLWGFPGSNSGTGDTTNTLEAPAGDDLEAPAGGGDGLDIPSEVDINVNTPQ